MPGDNTTSLMEDFELAEVAHESCHGCAFDDHAVYCGAQTGCFETPGKNFIWVKRSENAPTRDV
jgi:hypothetical protein